MRQSPAFYRATATFLAMMGVALTLLIFSLVTPNLPRATVFPVLAIVLVIFTGIFSFVIFGLLAGRQKALAQANAQLAQQRDILQGLWDATGLVSTLPDLDEVLQKIVDLSRPLFDAQYAALAVLSERQPSRIVQFITSGMPDQARHAIGHFPEGKGLLGEVIRLKRPVRVDDIGDHSASSGFPDHHPPMDTFLGVPLLFQGDVLGHLYMTNKPGGFSQSDETMAQLFARQAAVVIANARLYQERERYATLQERERIGRDLHDGVLQTLYGITLAMDVLLDAEPALSDSGRQEMTRIREALSLTMTEIRMFIQSLEATPVDFLAAVKDMLARLGNTDDLQFEFRDNGYRHLHPDVIHDLVLSVQEAVSNARRHGRATRIAVGFETDGPNGEYHVWVADNGQGFAFSESDSSHHGLRNIRRRMETWRGTLDIESRSGQGTTVRLQIPHTLLAANITP